MSIHPQLLSTLFLFTFLILAVRGQRNVIGYFTSWSVYGRNYFPSDIDVSRLTHINYAFANVAGGRCVLGDEYADTQKLFPGDVWGQPLAGNFHQLNYVLKGQHPHLKTLISLGGWSWSGEFSDIAMTASSRQVFVDSCVDMMIQYGFDGIDVDWEYPVEGGMSSNSYHANDGDNYLLLISEFRQALNQRQPSALLTIAAPGNPNYAAHVPVAQMMTYLDWMNVMTYDYAGCWDSVTGHQVPLYSDPADPRSSYFDNLNIHSAIQTYVSAGAPRSKLNLGIAMYGRSFGQVQCHSSTSCLYANFGTCPAGQWDGSGVFDYSYIEDKLATDSSWVRIWDDAIAAPYVIVNGGEKVVVYDDAQAVSEKSQYVVCEDLGGLFTWSLDGDRSATLLTAMWQGVQANCNTGVPDVDECATQTHNCHVNAACTNTPGSFTCDCNPGYSGDGTSCSDVDECAAKTDNCDSNAACTNTDGGFTCACNSGYIGDGTSCSDVNECTANMDNCDDNAVCTNTDGAFTCACGSGYAGDGVSCTDVNECAENTHDCDANAGCTNTDGSFTCACNAGYTGDGTTCSVSTGDDECAMNTHNCDVNAGCTNTDVGFTCACNSGYTGDGTTCSDVNECATNTDNCDSNAACTNTDGGFTCACNLGYAGDGTSCSDVDECAANTDNCDVSAACTNTDGGFTCACNSGYTGDGTTCSDVDECAANTDNCDSNAACTNTDGGFTCACNSGYTGDGTSCSDVDECAANTDNCDVNAACTNTFGGFTCACYPGYGGDGVSCSEACMDDDQALQGLLDDASAVCGQSELCEGALGPYYQSSCRATCATCNTGCADDHSIVMAMIAMDCVSAAQNGQCQNHANSPLVHHFCPVSCNLCATSCQDDLGALRAFTGNPSAVCSMFPCDDRHTAFCPHTCHACGLACTDNHAVVRALEGKPCGPLRKSRGCGHPTVGPLLGFWCPETCPGRCNEIQPMPSPSPTTSPVPLQEPLPSPSATPSTSVVTDGGNGNNGNGNGRGRRPKSQKLGGSPRGPMPDSGHVIDSQAVVMVGMMLTSLVALVAVGTLTLRRRNQQRSVSCASDTSRVVVSIPLH